MKLSRSSAFYLQVQQAVVHEVIQVLGSISFRHMRVQPASRFGCDHNRFVALTAKLGQQSLAAPVAVYIGRIEKSSHPCLRRDATRASASRSSTSPITANGPGAEADGADPESGAA